MGLSKITIILIPIILAVACRSLPNHKENFMKTSESQISPKTSPEGYYFEMSDQDVEKFSNKIEVINFGESLSRATELLGKPNEGPYIYGKLQANSIKAKKKVVYYIKKRDKYLTNLHYDRYVYLFFDGSDRLIEINSSSEKIKSREMPPE